MNVVDKLLRKEEMCFDSITSDKLMSYLTLEMENKMELIEQIEVYEKMISSSIQCLALNLEKQALKRIFIAKLIRIKYLDHQLLEIHKEL